ncbi:MAG: helix-turn-helix domain-containing protein [Curvibacter sp.]|jgi:cytoskeleton protein RodZ|nr:helix-turn-helix domain-containing protein [Curvibacter sp.]
MSEELVAGDAPATVGSATPAVTPSAGALLQQARLAAGVELSALAVALKVSVKKIEALESDRFDQLPDAVFVRALASSICRALKVDATPVLAVLPQSRVPQLDHDEVGLNTPFHTPGDIAKTPFLDRLSRPMVLAALAVLMGALVLIFFPSTEQRAEIGAIVASTPVAPTQAPALIQPAAGAVPAPASLPAPPAPSQPAASPAAVKPVVASVPPVAKPALPAPAPAANPGVAPREVTAPAKPSPVAAGAAPSADPEQAAGRKKLSNTGVVVFKTREASWIEVTDAKGTIQLSRMIEPGEPVGASGLLPLSVTIGRADVTEVTVRGKPFALTEVTRGGVARFEVK